RGAASRTALDLQAGLSFVMALIETHRRPVAPTEQNGTACCAHHEVGPEDQADRQPRLVVTVDTEEEGLWGGEFRMTGNTVENIQGVPRFQDVCDRLGIRPTYLVDAPVVQDDRASEILAAIHGDGRCEIGTHVHPWCNPPFDDVLDRQETYLCNLPVELQRAKVEWLTTAIEDRFGARPVSFRAGRYGLDIHGARILSELGYRVDSSVIPFTDYSAGGGPDFRSAPWQPYFVGGDELCRPMATGDLLEVPVSVGFNRRNFRRALQSQEFLGRAPFRRLRLEGLLDRTGLLTRIKLSPEQATAQKMQTLVDRYCESPSPVLVMMFHSSSLLPGKSPYVKSDADLTMFLKKIEDVCRDCLETKRACPRTLAEVAADVTAAR
ncbi:MAG: polysaccharide deacetylase family protein, partial [Planctomycetaceae bacterium]|nr:polysaccharide deacetylase family protein [Planctomycetaceae bacterium]